VSVWWVPLVFEPGCMDVLKKGLFFGAPFSVLMGGRVTAVLMQNPFKQSFFLLAAVLQILLGIPEANAA
jgi:hypothetical protein